MSQEKLFEIVISFLEPQQALVTLGAANEEEAIRKLRMELEGQVKELSIDNIKEVLTMPSGVNVSDLSADKTLN